MKGISPAGAGGLGVGAANAGGGIGPDGAGNKGTGKADNNNPPSKIIDYDDSFDHVRGLVLSDDEDISTLG